MEIPATSIRPGRTIRDLHWVSLGEDWEAGLDALAEAIRALIPTDVERAEQIRSDLISKHIAVLADKVAKLEQESEPEVVVAKAQLDLAIALQMRSEAASLIEAERLASKALATLMISGRDEREIAVAWHNLGVVRHRLGKVNEAADAFARSVQMHRRISSPLHDIYSSQCELAGAIHRLGRRDEAEDLVREAITALERNSDPLTIFYRSRAQELLSGFLFSFPTTPERQTEGTRVALSGIADLTALPLNAIPRQVGHAVADGLLTAKLNLLINLNDIRDFQLTLERGPALVADIERFEGNETLRYHAATLQLARARVHGSREDAEAALITLNKL